MDGQVDAGEDFLKPESDLRPNYPNNKYNIISNQLQRIKPQSDTNDFQLLSFI